MPAGLRILLGLRWRRAGQQADRERQLRQRPDAVLRTDADGADRPDPGCAGTDRSDRPAANRPRSTVNLEDTMSRPSHMTPAILLTLGSLVALGPVALAQTAPPPAASEPHTAFEPHASAPDEASAAAAEHFP